MVLRRRALLAAALVVGTALTGCGGAGAGSGAGPAPGTTTPGGTATGGPTVDSPAADDVVVRVERTGGFTTPVELATRLPLVSVHADGRAIEPGPQVTIYPAPALPSLLVRAVDPSRLPELVRLAADAGVDGGPAPDLGQPLIADATTTSFTVVSEAGRHRLDAYALVEASSGPGQPDGLPGASPDPSLSADQRAARQRLLDLLAALQDLPATLGADAVSAAAPYEPHRVAAFASPHDPAEGPDAARAAVRWPGPSLPGEPLGGVRDTGCVTATGEQARAVLDAAASATTITRWVSDDREWSVALRPLTPDERGCADLTG